VFNTVTNRYAIWFGRLVLLGVIANSTFVVSGLLWPHRVLAFFDLGPTNTPIWVSFSVYLLAQLSLFYIPAAIDPYRYKANAYLAVFCRFAGAVFFAAAVLFFGFPQSYVMFGIFDFVFAVPGAILLYFAFRTEAV
jgi:hypothetical protein